MSHDHAWRDSCESTRRDKHGRWLWRLVGHISARGHDKGNDPVVSSSQRRKWLATLSRTWRLRCRLPLPSIPSASNTASTNASMSRGGFALSRAISRDVRQNPNWIQSSESSASTFDGDITQDSLPNVKDQPHVCLARAMRKHGT